MNLKELIGGRRGFWIGIGAGAAVLLAELMIWTMPATRQLDLARDEWTRQVAMMNNLRAKAKNIPSKQSLEALSGYKSWLEDQATEARSFLEARAEAMESPLTAEGIPSQAAFQDAYRQAVKAQTDSLRNSGILGAGNRDVFKAYPWTSGNTLPNPGEYQQVLRDYWARVNLYKLCQDSGVSTVNRLDVKPIAPFNGIGQPVTMNNAMLLGIPFELNVTMPADAVTKFIDKILTITPSSNKPILAMQRLAIQAEPTNENRMANVQIDGMILLLRKDSRS